ncbi:hypothetical protein FHG87_013548 [Trinorchestia longiramus]|nr:hypothetical protein FHG87_013548 [Trinorchestia longiramus]
MVCRAEMHTQEIKRTLHSLHTSATAADTEATSGDLNSRVILMRRVIRDEPHGCEGGSDKKAAVDIGSSIQLFQMSGPLRSGSTPCQTLTHSPDGVRSSCLPSYLVLNHSFC